jgi:TP901 family phage tail tape measure protein
MAELNRQDLFSDDLLQAPLVLAKNLEVAVEAAKELVKTLQAQQESIKSADSISKVSKETKTLTEEQKELEKIQKQISTATVRQSDQYQEQQKKLLQLRLEQQKRNQEAKNEILLSKTVGDEYKKLTTRLEEARKKYKDLAAGGKATTDELKKQQAVFEDLNKKVLTIDKSVGQFQRNVGNYPGTFNAAAGSVKNLMGAFGIIGGLALFAKILKGVVDLTKEYEAANSTLQAVLGATSREMQQLREDQLALGASTQFTSKQVAELQTEFAKLGFPTKEIRDMTASTLDAALAMGSSLGEQAALTGATLKAFGLASTDAQRVNDVLAKSTSSSALSFEKLNNSMSTIAPVAAKFGFSLEGTTALLGELANAGFDASSAATATRNILLNLADANGKLAKSLDKPVTDLPSLVEGLKQLKDEGIDLGEALELTDVRSVAAFSTFLGGTDSVLKLNDTLEKATGTAERMAVTMGDNLRGDTLKLQSAWEGLVLTLTSGDSIFNKVLRTVTQLAASFISLITPVTRQIDLLQKEQNELNILVRQIKLVNEDQEERNRLIKELDEQYPDFLDNLDKESLSYEQIESRLADVNAEFIKRIALAAAEEEVLNVQRKINKSILDQRDATKELAKVQLEIEKGPQLGGREDGRQFEAAQSRAFDLQLKINAEKERQSELGSELNELMDALVNAQGLLTTKTKETNEEGKKSKTLASELSKEQIKFIEDERKARFEIQKLELELAISREKDIEKRADKQIELETLIMNEKLRGLKQGSDQELLILEQTQAKVNQIRVKQDDDLFKQQIDNIKKQGAKAAEEQQKILDERVNAIKKAAIDGNLSQEEAEKEILKVKKDLADEAVQVQIDNVQKLLAVEGLSYEERERLELELYKLKNDLLNAYFQNLESSEDSQIEKIEESLEKIKEIYDEFAQSITGIFKSLSESRISGIDAEIAKVDAQAERELFLAGNNEEAKQRIIAITEVKREQLEQKRKQEQQKQARLEKAAALVSAAINTSLAVVKALPKIPLSILVGALGAAQIAAIAAQPIPQFAEGGIAPGGLAIVGEQGRELMKSPSGKVSLTPSIPTMMNIAKGTEIIPHNETMRMMALNGLLPNKITSDNAILWAEINDLKETIKEYDQRIVNAIYDNGGDVITQGSLIYKVKKKQDGSRTMIRKKSLS